MHAQRMIVQFMTANCGRSKRRDDVVDTKEPRVESCPPNVVALQQLHKLLDAIGESQCTGDKVPSKPRRSAETDSDEEEEVSAKRSTQMKNALCATSALWRRDASAWMVRSPNKVHTRLDLAKHHKPASQRRSTHKQGDVSTAQGTAYLKLKQANISAWWRKVQTSDKKPNAQQTHFLEAVSSRCKTEAAELNRWNGPVKSRRANMLSEPVRICLFGDPGAGTNY